MKTGFSLVLLAVLWAVPSVASAQIVDDERRQEALRHYRNGQELMQDEQFEKAEQEFAKAIERDPLLTLAHYGRGQAFMALNRYPSAIQAFIGCRDAHQTIFSLRQSQTVAIDRRADEEIRELRDTIGALRSGRMKTMGGVASTVDTRVAQIENRIRDLERMRQQDSGTFQTPAEVSLALGSAYFRNGQREDAQREWVAAVEVNPRLGEAHNNLAVLHMLNGRKKDAEESVRAAERAGFRVNPALKTDIRKMGS
jgi:Flp pilus assembly protein TadD